MGAFRTWLVVAGGVSGLTAWGYHADLTAWPKRVLVILDRAWPMGLDGPVAKRYT